MRGSSERAGRMGFRLERVCSHLDPSRHQRGCLVLVEVVCVVSCQLPPLPPVRPALGPNRHRALQHRTALVACNVLGT